MSANEIDQRNLAAVADAYGELQLALDLQNAKLDRLVEAAFEDRDRAIRSISHLMQGYGAEEAIRLLEDRGWLARSHYFGFLRGHMFARASRQAAHDALHQLPEALREREALMVRRDDLLLTRRCIVERLDRERLDVGRTDLSRELKTGRVRG